MDYGQVLFGTLLVVAGALLLAVYNSWKGKVLKSGVVKDDQVLLINMLVSGLIMLAFSPLLGVSATNVMHTPEWLKGITAFMPLWVFALICTGILNLGIQPLNNAALRREDTSLVTPLSSATPVLLIIMSYYLLGQWPSRIGRWGIFLVALGAYILYLKGKPVVLPKALAALVPEKYHKITGYYLGPWLRIFQSVGARLALLSAYLGSISINFDALMVKELNPAGGPGVTMIFVGLCTLIYMSLKGKLRGLTTAAIPWKTLLWIAAIYAASNILMGAGYLYVLAPYVGALKRTQIFWTVVIATLVLHEAYARDRIIGAAIISGGVILINLFP